MKKNTNKSVFMALSTALLSMIPLIIQAEEKIEYSPYAGRSYPSQVFFGDTHHHVASGLTSQLIV